jgi:hypothetical protein
MKKKGLQTKKKDTSIWSSAESESKKGNNYNKPRSLSENQ